MFLKKAFAKSSLNLKQELTKNSFKLNKLSLKSVVDFKKFDVPPEQLKRQQKNKSSYEVDKNILSNISNVKTEIHQNRADLSDIYEENKNDKNKFVLNVNYIHDSNLEQLLDYYLYNHEHFNSEELDHFLYVFCSRSELTNKISIKIKELENHKSIALIWNYFQKNYKKMSNIDDCNKFLYLFFIYSTKYSFNRDDFVGKFFNKSNNLFFLNTVEKYMRLSLDKIPIGKLLNMVTILEKFKSINYYEFLKNREDEVEKLPYWTLRRMLVRVNTNVKHEKSLRQLINLLLNPLTKDLTSLDYNEKSYLFKHLCFMDSKIILISSSKKLKDMLYEDLIKYAEEMSEELELNLNNMKFLANICQAANLCPKLQEDGRIMKVLKKFISAYERLNIKAPNSKDFSNEKIDNQDNFNFSSTMNNIKNDIYNNNNNLTETKSSNNAEESNEKEFSQDLKSGISNVDNNFRSDSINEFIDEKLKSGSSVNNKEDLFFEEIEELNELDLKLRVIKKKEDDELEFLDSEALDNPASLNKSSNLEFDIFKKNSELEKFFFGETENILCDNTQKTENIGKTKQEESTRGSISPQTSQGNSIDSHSENNLNTNENQDFLSKDNMFDFESVSSPALSNSIGTTEKSNSETIFTPSESQTTNKNPTQFYTKDHIYKDQNSLSIDLHDVVGYYFLVVFHQVIFFKDPSFRENKEFAVSMLKLIKKVLFNMDINFIKEKIKINIIFDAFVILNRHGIADKELFNFLLDNFIENMVNMIIMESFVAFINWTNKYLTPDEKSVFMNRITKILLEKLTKDYTIYNFFRVTSIVCSINRKRTNITDNLHFELISFIDAECTFTATLKLFADYQKGMFKEVHKDYSRNLVSFLLGKIKIKDLNSVMNPATLIDFYFAMLSLDLEIFDPEVDKKILMHCHSILKYLETLPLFEVELYNVVSFFYNVMNKYREDNCEKAIGLFFAKVEEIISNKNILMVGNIDRNMIYFALKLLQKGQSMSLVKTAVRICDKIFEKTKNHLDFNLTETVTALEKLLEHNIICKSIVKNFLVNIQIFKRLKETETFKLDDQTTFDINLINYKYQNVDRSKNIVNDLLEQLKNIGIISEELFRISVLE